MPTLFHTVGKTQKPPRQMFENFPKELLMFTDGLLSIYSGFDFSHMILVQYDNYLSSNHAFG